MSAPSCLARSHNISLRKLSLLDSYFATSILTPPLMPFSNSIDLSLSLTFLTAPLFGTHLNPLSTLSYSKGFSTSVYACVLTIGGLTTLLSFLPPNSILCLSLSLDLDSFYSSRFSTAICSSLQTFL